MQKQLRLRRRIDHEEEIEMDGNNLSPLLCMDCGRLYPLIDGSSNIRCKECDSIYRKKIGFSYVGFKNEPQGARRGKKMSRTPQQGNR